MNLSIDTRFENEKFIVKKEGYEKINNIPEEIKKKVYIEYIEPDMILTELFQIINCEESRRLNYIPLEAYLKKILHNDIVVKSLIKNDWIFNKIYKSHLIEKKIYFEKFDDIISSMALCWLMYLYH